MKRQAAEQRLLLFVFAGEIELSLDGRKHKWLAIAIELIAYQRVAYGLHMYPYLVGAAGVYLELHERIERPLFGHFVIGDRHLALPGHDHPAISSGMLCNRAFYTAIFGRYDAMYQARIKLHHIMLLEKYGEMAVRRLVLCKADNAAGVFVQAMYYPDSSSLLRLDSMAL